MPIQSWLQRIIARRSDAKLGAPSLQPVAKAAKARPDREDTIAYAVNLSGLVVDQPDAIAFYVSTFADHPARFVTYDDLRKHGDLLDKESLKALGLRGNVKLSAQFLATLNERGRADPLGAASIIGLAVSAALCTLRDLASMETAGIDSATLLASNMAAGPCGPAAELDGRTMPIGECPILPLRGCSHPDQCGCGYQSRLTILDDL